MTVSLKPLPASGSSWCGTVFFIFFPFYGLTHPQMLLRGSDPLCVVGSVWKDAQCVLQADVDVSVAWREGAFFPGLSAPTSRGFSLRHPGKVLR